MSDAHVVVIGGGFSGTALAIHLARLATGPLNITLVEPRPVPGQGVAYSTTEPSHRINVPASRMQLSGAEQGDFERWYCEQEAYYQDPAALSADGALYPRRELFGRYVAWHFSQAALQDGITLRHLQDRAVAIASGQVLTASGEHLKADVVVLAVSHPPPALPGLLGPLADHPGIIANPWQVSRFDDIAPDASVAIIGSGLTMADVVASLDDRGHHGPILAFSRRGLLPRPNLSGDYPDWSGDYQRHDITRIRQWLRLIRRDIHQATLQGIPWQKVMDEVRSHGQSIWQHLPLEQQQRFLHHLRSWWDVHRYRIAPQVADMLDRRWQKGQLEVRAARLLAATADGNRLTLTLGLRGGKRLQRQVEHLIVTTGPAHSTLASSQELFQSLTQIGAIQPDPLGLGLLVNEHSQAIDRGGRANSRLLVVGPAARGYFGELMGLPQVADHALAVALETLNTLRHM
ncbi:FAD/NAD(P)-binding protein [Serratia sp. D1N4]